MIAWTSPLPTVRSMPWRISWSGSATGTTRRSRMTRCWSVAVVSVGHGRVRAPWMGVGWMGGLGRDARRDEVGEGHRVERAGDGVADADPQHVDGAARDAIAQRWRARGRRWRRPSARSGLRGRAGPRPSRSSRVRGRARSRRGRRGCWHEAGLAQADDELLEVGARQVLLGGDLGEADAGPVPWWRASSTISRTPYSPFVEKATAPLPW